MAVDMFHRGDLPPDAAPEISFRGVTAAGLRGLSLEVAGGGVFSLLGADGAGGSTALMVLAGFVRAESGEVLVAGRPIGTLPAHRRGIGVVGAGAALFPHMTVAENVGYP